MRLERAVERACWWFWKERKEWAPDSDVGLIGGWGGGKERGKERCNFFCFSEMQLK